MRRLLPTLPIVLVFCLLPIASSALAQPTAKEVPPLVIPAAGDEALLAAWATWRGGFTGHQPSVAEAAQKELLGLKEDLGAANLEALSTAFARASSARIDAEDPVAGVNLAAAAVALAPDLPWAHLALASAHFRAEPGDVGRWGAALVETVRRLASDPRYLRPALADLFGAVLAAIFATAAAVVVVLFARHARYFLHDFHHLFPRGAARWQTLPLAVIVLALPIVFRLGALPVLLALFASVTLYLTWSERIVVAVALSAVALLPAMGGTLTAFTAFAGTPAEDVYLLEGGGLDAAAAAARVRNQLDDGRADFEELFALGRYELRRGRYEEASELLKRAAPLRTNDARVLTNLGNARFAQGDLQGAQSLYAQANAADPQLAAALYNLSRVHYRRAWSLTDAAEAQELEKAQTAQEAAQALDPSLLSRPELPRDAPQPVNRLLLSPGLSSAEISRLGAVPEVSERVSNQFAFNLVGMPAGPLAYGLPILIAAALLGFGGLRLSVSASRACDKCGRAVCRRCDPELGLGSGLCHQCVNVFARKGLVAPQVRVRKQLEVDRHQARSERLSWIFGALCSGAGHLFAGSPVRGAVFSFSFLFLVTLAVFRDGVLRAPWGEFSVLLRLLPVGALLLGVYLLSLNSLRKAHSR